MVNITTNKLMYNNFIVKQKELYVSGYEHLVPIINDETFRSSDIEKRPWIYLQRMIFF